MSKWTGFLIGLVLALTAVMTLVRPDVGSELAPAEARLETPVTENVAVPTKAVMSESPPTSDHEDTGQEKIHQEQIDAPVVLEADPPIPDFQWSESDAAEAGPDNSAAIAVVDPPVRSVVTESSTPASQAIATDLPTVQWYSFWHPFTSELSANGFRDRLERVTGLDYRVVRADSGEYHVAFGYQDESSRERNLVAIEAATGLNLRGASF